MDLTQIDLPFVHLDDEEFELVIFEMNQGLIDFDTDCLETLYFNPLNSKNSTAQTFDIDLDQNSLLMYKVIIMFPISLMKSASSIIHPFRCCI